MLHYSSSAQRNKTQPREAGRGLLFIKAPRLISDSPFSMRSNCMQHAPGRLASCTAPSSIWCCYPTRPAAPRGLRLGEPTSPCHGPGYLLWTRLCCIKRTKLEFTILLLEEITRVFSSSNRCVQWECICSVQGSKAWLVSWIDFRQRTPWHCGLAC